MGRKMKKGLIKILTLGLLGSMLQPLLPMNGLEAALASDVCTTVQECREVLSNANQNISNLAGEEAVLTGQIDELINRIENIQLQIEQSEARIAQLQQEIDQLTASIEAIESDIEEKEEELEAINVEIQELSDIIGERMVVTQRNRFTNIWLELLGQSPDLLTLIRNFAMMSNILEHDARLMEQLHELVTRQEALIAELENQRQALADQQQDLFEQQAGQEEEIAIHSELQAELAEQQRYLATQREAIIQERLSEQDLADIANRQIQQIEELERRQSAGGGVAANTISGGGNFIIPLERGRVSCEFGNSCYFGHTGIDLANFGDTSTRVLAAADGIVTVSGWHRMYGNWVVITHNINGQVFTTLYAHLHQSPFVSVGDLVSQGTILGTMGNTGNSFGAHLHFEIYVGAMNWPHAQNPRNFIHFPASW